SPRQGPATHSPPTVSKLAPWTAQTHRPSFDLRNSPGAQSRRRPACGQTLSQARTATPLRCSTSDSIVPSTKPSASAKPPSGIRDRVVSLVAVIFNEVLTNPNAAGPILGSTGECRLSHEPSTRCPHCTSASNAPPLPA